MPLSTFASLRTTAEPRELKKFQQLNAVRIQGVIPPQVPLDQALGFLENEARKILPQGFTIDYAGESRQLSDEGSKFLGTFLLSAILIYLVLAAQFESFRDPFIILAGSVPLAISGALLFSFLGFTTLNIYSQVGSDHAGRPGVQERHPHRAVCQSPSGNRKAEARRHHRSGGHAAASDPDDDGGDRGRAFSACARDRARSGRAQQHRNHAGERHDRRHALHAVGRAVDLHARGADSARMRLAGHVDADMERHSRHHKYENEWIAITLLLALLMGCRTVGPNYSRPAIKSPDAFRGAPDATRTDAASLADLKWFEVFKDEQLQNLIRTALESELRSARRRGTCGCGTRQSRNHQGGSVSDHRRLDQHHDISDLAQRSIPASSGLRAARTFGSLALISSRSKRICGAGCEAPTEAARADFLATEENRKTVVTTLVSDVAGAYFNLLELDMELAIAERTLTTREESLKLIRNREQSGLATLLEVRQGEQLVHSAAQVIPNIEQLIEQTENQISLLLGKSGTDRAGRR